MPVLPPEGTGLRMSDGGQVKYRLLRYASFIPTAQVEVHYLLMDTRVAGVVDLRAFSNDYDV